MKKLLIPLAILLLGFINVNAQTDTISENIFQFNGNLGIGTSTPSSGVELVCDEIINFPSFGIFSIKNNHYATFDGYSANNQSHIATLINGRRSRGTILYPENVEANDRITGIVSAMYFGQEFQFNSSIEFYVGEGIGTSSYPSYISFKTTDIDEIERSERMRLSTSGNLGIGTQSPKTKLHIKDGDIYIEDISNGIIMKSPDGKCWKGTMGNQGLLDFSQVDCPGEIVTSVEIESLNSDFLVFPNPANEIINIDSGKDTKKVFFYSIYNTTGQLIKSGQFNARMYSIDISNLPKGTYLVKIQNKRYKVLQTSKVVKN